MAEEYASIRRESEETTDLYDTTEGTVLAIVTDGTHEKGAEGGSAQGTADTETLALALVKEDTISAILSRGIDEPYAL